MEVTRHHITDDPDLDSELPAEYALLDEDPVELDRGFSTIIVVDNLPMVDQAKYEKLLGVLRKLYSQIGEIVQIYMPQEQGKTLGFAFIEFPDSYAAANAVKQTNGYKLDKAHIFKVNHYEDFLSYEKYSDEFEPIEMKPYKPLSNLWWWLEEEIGVACDQYAVRYAEHTEIFWNDTTKRKPESVYRKKDMTESFVNWSPYGTYLSTLHKQGVILWGGKEWEQVHKLPQFQVKLMAFSPKESYLVTISPHFQHNDNPKDPQAIIVWDVRTGAKKRGFLATKDQTYPVFKWSHDEKYFARMSEDTITIYETPSMRLLDKKSLKVPGVKDFSWSPSDNVIACWVPESGNKPARVLLIDIPSRNIKRSHNLFKVQDCNLHWHEQGDYLCVKVDRISGKKNVYTHFELYRMREKDIPIETVEIKEKVVAFAWEPKGDRFAVIHGGVAGKTNVSFYTMGNKKGETKLRLLKTLEKKPANHLFWSPQGGNIVLAGFGTMGGILEFYNVDELISLRIAMHNMVTDLAWDPTGRFVATSISYWRHQLDNGWTVWNFQGKELVHVNKDRFFQLVWRPRPPTLLSPEQAQDVEKNLKKYSRKYKEQDWQRRKEIWEAFKRRREAEKEAFYALMNERRAERAQQKDHRLKLLGYDSDEEEAQAEWVENEIEELIGEEEVEIIEDDFAE